MSNTALTPLPSSERFFGFNDHASLWLSLGVGLLVMRDGVAAIAGRAGFAAAWLPLAATLTLGAVLVALMSGSMTRLVCKFIGRFGLPLVIASLLWLTWQFLGKASAQGLCAIWNKPGTGGMSGCAGN